MTTLKDLTNDLHVKAEAHPFTQDLLSGNIQPAPYATLLANQLVMYTELERLCVKHGLLIGLEGLLRKDKILQDILELNQPVHILPSTAEFVKHLQTCSDSQLLAHVYVKHMGDLYGGQILKSRVPGSGNMYDFDNRSDLIAVLRSRLTIDMADEAREGFQRTLNLFDEIYEICYNKQ
jgi:heme oxygenase